MSAYMGARAVGDLCTDALDVSIGTCDYPFNVASNFIQNEGSDVSCGATRSADGWIRIQAGGNKRIRVTYGSDNKNAMLTIYGATPTAGFPISGVPLINANTLCNNTTLTQITCVNDITTLGGQIESVEFNTQSTNLYYLVRVSNVEDGNAMSGNLCISEVLARDDCSSALSDNNFIKLGDCNVRFDVLNSYVPNNVINNSTECNNDASSVSKDAWVVYDHPISSPNTSLSFEYTITSIQTGAGIFVYEQATPNCATLSTNDRIACENAGGGRSVSVRFNVIAGRKYFIRVVNAEVAGNTMTGLACLYEDSKRAEDDFYSAPSFSFSNPLDCGKIFNLQSNFNADGSIPASEVLTYDVNCPAVTSTRNDAWGRFDVGATLPPGLNSIIVEYNNDNRDPSIANDVALSIYRMPLTALAAPGGNCASATTVSLNSSGILNVGTTNYGVGTNDPSVLTQCPINNTQPDSSYGDDEWFTITTDKRFSVTYESSQGDAWLLVYEGSCASTNLENLCGDGPSGTGITSVQVDPSGVSTTYYIRILNKSNTVPLQGKFSIFEVRPAPTTLTQILCSNNVVEGTEQAIISGSNLQLNSIYFIRVSNLGSFPQTTQGTLCIRNNIVPEGDLCNNAFTQMVGDCDFSFDVPLSYVNNTTNTIPVCNSAIATVYRDAWVTFTATNTQTTFEYLTVSKDAALAIYRGNCTNLILVGCTNSVTGAGLERLKVNTIVGLQYYVRIMDIQNNITDMTGQFCIYNTTERDVCDDDDLVTNTVGMCNIPFDVPNSFLNSDLRLRNFQSTEGSPAGQFPVVETGGSLTQNVQSSCENPSIENGTPALPFLNTNNNPDASSVAITTDYRDGWTRLIGNGNIVTLSYQNKEATTNPAIVVYTALKARGPVNCSAGLDGAGLSVSPNLGANQYACANKFNFNGIQTESVTFQTNSGQNYLIRIIDLNSVGSGVSMTGNLCIADGRQDYEDPCANTITPGAGGPRSFSLGDCSVALNVVKGLNACTDPANTSANYSGVTGGAGGCTANCGGNEDTWARFRRNFVCVEAIANAETPSTSQADCNNKALAQLLPFNPSFTISSPEVTSFYKHNPNTNKCQCGDNTISNNSSSSFSIEYDNRDGLLTTAPDVKIALYREGASFNCNDESTYTFLECADGVIEGIERITITGLSTTHGSGGEYYLLRLMNKDGVRSAYGTICSYFGNSLADITCPPVNDYGALDGNFRGFMIPGGTYSPNSAALGNPSVPSNSISLNGCVLAGGSNPTALDPPIRSNAWMKFQVPLSAAYTAVTVQFDNSLGSGTIQNSAIAIYGFPGGVGMGSCNSLILLDCANTVYVGTESSTFTVTPGYTYFVRVMNVHNNSNPNALPGRIRVFPYTQCTAGPELVVDGSFAMWPATTGTQPNSNTIAGGQATNTAFDTVQNSVQIKVPEVNSTNPYNPTYTGPSYSASANSLDYNMNTGVARFATDYGFLRDRTAAGYTPNGGIVGGIDATTATYLQLSGERQELAPEGMYTVAKTPWTVKDNWFGYGNGYSGYGGRLGGTRGVTQLNYCSSGSVNEFLEPCIPRIRTPYPTTVGQYNTNPNYNRPQGTPMTSDANFMIVNGSFDPSGGLPPGKVWCQTIDRAGGSVGYYVFSVWVQNMKATNSFSDVPMLRMSICDMENPLDGTIPAKVSTPGGDKVEANGLVTNRSLPGVTYAGVTPVKHIPAPPTNRLQAPRVQFSYGAARSCNLPSESRDARLKVLGSSFLVNENPDQWVLVRCIYRSPRDVTEFNACIENLSLTKNGNDFAIDDISIRECLNPDAQSFDRMLRGDACQLTADPKVVGLPLAAEMIDFTGKLIGNKVFLNWIVNNEIQVAKYQIQRSLDGTNYSAIGVLDAKGTQNGLADYSFIDSNLPYGAKGTIFYRLNMIDANGLEKSGAIVSVDLKNLDTFDIKIIPNPINSGEEVNIKYNVTEDKTAIGIFDMLGNKISEYYFQSKNGENDVKISTKNLGSAIYIIKVNHNGQTNSKKLVVR
jgi:hypothetical protein